MGDQPFESGALTRMGGEVDVIEGKRSVRRRWRSAETMALTRGVFDSD